MKIYLAIACTDYESSDVMKAFRDKAEAEAFVKKCIDHSEKQPEVPAFGASDNTWDNFNRKDSAWRKKHPAGDNYSADGFHTQEIELV